MKYSLCLILMFCALPMACAQRLGIYQHGTVVRMRMGDCQSTRHGFMVAMGGPAQTAGEDCPEYTLVSDKVVFVIVGKFSSQLIPLADEVDFRFHNNELAVRVDDGGHESKFNIKQMTLRSEWDMIQKHIENQMSALTQPTDSSLALRTRD